VELLDLPDPLDHWDQTDLVDQTVKLDLKDHRDRLVSQDHKDKKETLVLQAPLGLLDLQDLLVL